MKNTTTFVRELNGYRLLYLPDHPRAMKNSCWDGYVYEHIVVAEKFNKSPLSEDVVVHHLNGDKSNNRTANLLVLERAQHAKLHMWLSSGAPGVEKYRENGMNSLKASFEKPQYCKYCEATLQRKQTDYCSTSCSAYCSRKAERPTKKQLKTDIANMSIVKVGKKYNVSDNAIRKWMKSYNLKKSTMSQAAGTLAEGAETTGEVEPS